ncbi:MAG: hypothetical protein ABI175_22885 [Polyangiales bacterium]
MRNWSKLRAAAGFAGAHATLLGVIWLAASLLYVVVFAGIERPAWLVVDLALIAGGIVLLTRRWAVLGLSVVTARRFIAIAAVATACVLVSQLLVPDRHAIYLDETNYLATLRGQTLLDGIVPFNLRWLSPFLAGRWNLLPVTDAPALAAINFGALAVTGTYLTLLLLRIGVSRMIAWAAPVFLLGSYLGSYAAMNRLVLDPFNYALIIVLVHALVRAEHARFAPWILLLATCNSEKAVYWIPMFAVFELMRRARPWSWRDLVASLGAAVRGGAPALIYLLALALYLRGSAVDNSGTAPEILFRMGFSWLDPEFYDATAYTTASQTLWFPFGAFTVYAVLGLVYARDRWAHALFVFLLPVMAQTLLGRDTERMAAYSFVVYLPLGALYLTRALSEFPPRLAKLMFTALLAVCVLQHYLLPFAARLRAVHVPFAVLLVTRPHTAQLILSAAEVLVVGAFVWLHLAVYGRDVLHPRRV